MGSLPPGGNNGRVLRWVLHRRCERHWFVWPFTTLDQATYDKVGGGTTAYDELVVLSQKLTENLVPKQGRWCVVPPWIKTFLTQDPRFTSYNTPDARLTILSGKLDASAGMASDAYLGKIEGMDVYESMNAPHLGGTIGIAGSQDVCLAGHTMAVTKAEGINKVEAYRPPYRFADAVKGLGAVRRENCSPLRPGRCLPPAPVR